MEPNNRTIKNNIIFNLRNKSSSQFCSVSFHNVFHLRVQLSKCEVTDPQTQGREGLAVSPWSAGQPPPPAWLPGKGQLQQREITDQFSDTSNFGWQRNIQIASDLWTGNMGPMIRGEFEWKMWFAFPRTVSPRNPGLFNRLHRLIAFLDIGQQKLSCSIYKEKAWAKNS